MDTKPSCDYHPEVIKKMNQDIRQRNAIGLDLIDLSEEAVLAAARRETGLERFGDECFLPGLRVLLHALETEAELNPFGRLAAQGEIMGALKNRLWANACFEAHPEILARKIAAPIIIVGLARSGTTRLHRMLAADTRLLHLQAWEGFNPAPRMGQADLGKAARFEEVRAFLEMGRQLNPGAFEAAHPMAVDWAEEEILLLNQSFCGWSPSLMFHVPSYTKWFLEHDKTDAYLYMAKLMKLISWSRGDDESKRWVLKTPQHMLNIGLLLKIFPDATLIFAHRDPIKTVGSTMSLAWNFSVMNTDRPCRALVRDGLLDFCAEMALRSIEARKQIPKERQLDVQFDDMNRDWRSVMRTIYEGCNLKFTQEAEAQLADWLANCENENFHGNHRYSVEEYGTSNAEIGEKMKLYIDNYDIMRE